ncbi:MAG: VanW family protein [Clostridia bacterium]|nr:VanW family protein [Clostridia bacterium]
MWKYNTKTRSLGSKFLLAIFLIIFTISYACAEENIIKYGYNLNPLNVRAEMSIESKWMSQYPEKSTIEIYEDLGEWYRVENGYVMKEYVYDSVEINQKGRLLINSFIYEKANFYSKILGYAESESEINFISKTNGFLELDVGGYVVEKNVTFSFVYPDEVKENTLHVDQMTMHNMPDLPIQYVGTLEKRTGGQGVTTKSKLYFKDEIPIYDIIDGFAYFPSGKHIYKISIDKFSKIKNIGSNYEILAAYRTIFYSSSSARKHNIYLVSTYLDGVTIGAGKTFSYNSITGSRSASKGYLEAPVIMNGEYVPGYGGGVCQVSSTIYAAVKNQEMFNVTEREEHGLQVSYLPLNMDATVSYGSIDLKFINNYPFDVKLNVKSEEGVCLVTITRVE